MNREVTVIINRIIEEDRWVRWQTYREKKGV